MTESGYKHRVPATMLIESELAHVRYDHNSLGNGDVSMVPRRHGADFFDKSAAGKSAILHAPDGYPIERTGGQTRMYDRSIPRHTGAVADQNDGIRCVLAKRSAQH